MHTHTVNTTTLLESYLPTLKERHHIVILMNHNEKLQKYFKDFFGVKISLNNINVISVQSENEALKLWNELCKTKSVYIYLFTGSILKAENK